MLLISSRRWISNYKKKRHVCKFLSIMTEAREKSGKYLSKMEGVYTTNIDVKQKKVTVVGNVEPWILIKKIVCPVEEVNPILTSSTTI
ncbi:hypothetical protein Bca4012_052416 [Brassica carinata]|uniref:HMA domain-containing protein n=1 Tax=Brassica oleracea var. oleracea TaxID=109376 RepID=A0A0D3AW93_BRAOL